MMGSGKQLERLVQQIERQLLPPGFTVSVNERVFNDDGVQIAEFDIVIAGRLGSSSIRWLIECRDRPEDGSAPVSWIEQLVGRRDLHRFDKVTAVSTTGFSPGARKHAEARGIDLRSVDVLTIEDIADWFRLASIGVFISQGELIHVNFTIEDDTSSSAKDLLAAQLEEIRHEKDFIDRPILFHTRTGEPSTIHNAWQSVMNQLPQIFDGLQPNGEKRPRTVHANYTNPEDRFQLLTDEGSIHIVQITFQAILSVIFEEVPISRTVQYSHTVQEETIAQSVNFPFKVGEISFDVAFHKLGEKDKTFIVVDVGQPDDRPTSVRIVRTWPDSLNTLPWHTWLQSRRND